MVIFLLVADRTAQAAVAQSVERHIGNVEVTGPNSRQQLSTKDKNPLHLQGVLLITPDKGGAVALTIFKS